MITLDLATALGGMTSILTAVCVVTGVVVVRQQRRLSARCLAADAALAALQREMQLTASVVAKIGEGMQEAVCDPVDCDPVDMRGAAQSFDRAIEFARRGGGAAQLMQRFGMSRGEVELTIRMHGARRSA